MSNYLLPHVIWIGACLCSFCFAANELDIANDDFTEDMVYFHESIVGVNSNGEKDTLAEVIIYPAIDSLSYISTPKNNLGVVISGGLGTRQTIKTYGLELKLIEDGILKNGLNQSFDFLPNRVSNIVHSSIQFERSIKRSLHILKIKGAFDITNPEKFTDQENVKRIVRFYKEVDFGVEYDETFYVLEIKQKNTLNTLKVKL